MKHLLLGFLMLFVQFSFGQTTSTYQYDGNGNMIADSYNGIGFIQYDIDNRPIAIYKTNGTKIEHSYDVSGERVRKFDGTANTYYIQGADGQTEAIANDDPTKTVFNIDKIGRAERQGSAWVRSYYLKDHLGSIRMTLADNGSIISYDDYYPFGLYMPGRSGRMGDAAGRYKFTGKERDAETGFDYFGARYYDSRIARWMAVDPLAEKYPGWSPYNYCANNPYKYIDYDGRDFWERISNFITGKGWRDDNIEENFAEEDWNNATPQLAEEFNISEENVEYRTESNIAGHYTTIKDDKATIVMTKGGYEKLDEKNIDNSRNSMSHEVSHFSEGKEKLEIIDTDYKERIKSELKAISNQKKHSSWINTTSTYKQNTNNYEQSWINDESLIKNLEKLLKKGN